MAQTSAPFIIDNGRIYQAEGFPKIKIEMCASQEWRTCFDTGMCRVVIARKTLESEFVWYSRNYENHRGINLLRVEHPTAGALYQIACQEEDLWYQSA